jgi:hypothetical protein
MEEITESLNLAAHCCPKCLLEQIAKLECEHCKGTLCLDLQKEAIICTKCGLVAYMLKTKHNFPKFWKRDNFFIKNKND